jgi:hypothetical protein
MSLYANSRQFTSIYGPLLIAFREAIAESLSYTYVVYNKYIINMELLFRNSLQSTHVFTCASRVKMSGQSGVALPLAMGGRGLEEKHALSRFGSSMLLHETPSTPNP